MRRFNLNLNRRVSIRKLDHNPIVGMHRVNTEVDANAGYFLALVR